jgi:hypothetical protein
MSVLPLYAIDASKSDEALFSVSLPLSRGSREFISAEGYCIQPTCSCATVHLHLADVTDFFSGSPQPSQSTAKELFKAVVDSWNGERPGFKFEFDLETRKLTLSEDQPASDEQKEALELLRPHLTEERIGQFAAHLETVKAWRNENWWRHQDWTHLPENETVSWYKVFPRDSLEEFEHEGAGYLVDDHYCIIPSCTCHSAFLTFGRLEAEGDLDSKAKEVVTVRLSVKSDTTKFVDVAKGEEAFGRGIYRKFVESHLLFIRNLSRRYKVLREFGVLVEKQRRARRPKQGSSLDDGFSRRGQPASPKVKVPRNAPCPCGSGKKYKSCCGREPEKT